jgi:nitrilase
MKDVVRVACVQAEPVISDRAATIEKLAALALEAAAGGARLALFPETFVPVYPSNRWARELAHGTHAAKPWSQLAQQSVELPDESLAASAREAGIWFPVGVDELERGTIYNSLLLDAPDGTLALHHRKLVPTNHERLACGPGDGRGLETVATDAGVVGGLICWENFMPLARFALCERGVEVYLAPTAEDSEGWLDSMRHVARESRALVLSCCIYRRASSYPPTCPSQGTTTSSAGAAPPSSRRPARISQGRSGTRSASSTRTSTRRCSTARGSASIRPVTTIGPTCCRSG